ncbi:class I SAM-dependent methyltransferase, partial [Gemmobacter nanjingensis]|uniref:hypothetical protein n=1 Tax=Gemmobacter nanjingensis TaxID=488454 RepID=UPI0016720DE9
MVRKPTNPRPAARDIRPESQLDPAAKATAVSTDDPGLHIPLSSQAVFWRPRHMRTSPMLGQLPFVFWLMETLRPRNIVQLGLGDGLVYMALCQAAERLGGTTAIWGLQTAAGGLPPEFQAEHDAYYADFSTLMTVGPSRKIPGSLSEDEIDLLVMDAGTDAALPGQWNTEWLPRVSDRGVVLICNPDHLPDDAELRRDLLSGEGRSLVMDPVSAGTTGGIGIALRGGNVPGRLTALVAQRPGKPAYLAARRVFNRLGQGLEHMQHIASQQAMIAAMQARLEAVEQQRGDVAERTEAQAALRSYLESRIDELRGELEDRLGDIAALSEQVSRIPALQAERDALTQELSDLRPALRDAQEKRSAHWARVEALQAEAKTSNSQIEALMAENALLKR